MAELHSDRITAVCVDGGEYRADARGVFDVPDALAPRLMADFGLRLYAPEPEPGPASGAATGTPDAAPAPSYARRSAAELLAEAGRLGVAVPDGATRRGLIAALTKAAAGGDF